MYRFHPYCFRCYCVLNPDTDIPCQYKLREHYLRDALRESFPGLEMVFDQPVDGGCSKKRPDVRIECLTHTVVIECDEGQHKSYQCENKRVMELFQDLGNRPLVVVRFNPDSYTEGSKQITGCFNVARSGAFSPNKQEWDWRLRELRRALNRHLRSVPEKDITIQNLFYDTP